MPKLSCNTQNIETYERELYLQSAASILDCVSDANPDPELLDILGKYLSAQGSKPMTECVHNPHSPFLLLSEVQDCLGWDKLVEGHISTLWLEVMSPYLSDTGRKSITKWGCRFIDSLLSLTHKQWILRNSKVHYATKGLTASHQDKLVLNVR